MEVETLIQKKWKNSYFIAFHPNLPKTPLKFKKPFWTYSKSEMLEMPNLLSSLKDYQINPRTKLRIPI